jgi:predicted PurR-regulated permease PerM
MKPQHLFSLFVLSLVLLCLYLLYRVLSPFLSPILWAVLLAIAFYPLFTRFQKALKKREILSALAMTTLVLFLIALPFTILTASLAAEVVEIYRKVEAMIESGQLQAHLGRMGEVPALQWIWERTGRLLDLSQFNPPALISKNLQQVSTFLFLQTTTILKGLSTFLVGFFFTLLSLYYLFKDGARLVLRLKQIFPLPAHERELFVRRLTEMIRATVYGGILIALVQGMLGGLAFWAVGISSPIFWGTAMAFLSFIPVGGTALIWLPASIFLFVEGAWIKGVVLIAVGVLVISMVDNLLRPFLLSARTHIHPLLLFFSVLGGVDAFGLIGLVAGPLVVSLFLTLVEIYAENTRIGRSRV